MNIPAERWHRAIRIRHSRRSYLEAPIAGETRKKIVEFTTGISEETEGVRILLLDHGADRVFTGFIGSYGRFKWPATYLAMVGDTRDAHVRERIGYAGEAAVLEATAMGLGTCWIGGSFKPEAARELIGTAPHERVYAITPLGHVVGDHTVGEKLLKTLAGSRKRKPLKDLLIRETGNRMPDWMVTALECARLAPSSINRQPWRFEVGEDQITVYAVPGGNGAERLDCGIAMLHIEVGALYGGTAGRWQLLDPPGVAVFSPLQGRPGR